MKLKKMALIPVLVLAFVLPLILIVPEASAFTCDDGTTTVPGDLALGGTVQQINNIVNEYCKTKGSTYTSQSSFTLNPAGESNCTKGGCIEQDLQILVNVLAIGVGIVATTMIVVGGIQYATSRDNPQAVQAAKSKIINAVIAMIAFVFIYALLQFLVPGGVFNK